MGIKDEMPLLARHIGEWEGTYTYVDPSGEVIDRHTALLTHSFPDPDGDDYFQVNHYFWPDGKEERIEFPGLLKDGKLHFNTERIDGFAWEIDENTIILQWKYVADPSVGLYEMINLDPTGNHRTRTWHWLKDGACFQRTLINETRRQPQ
jgi:hypothetical protein